MWNDLGLIDKARMIQLAVKSGITDLRTIEEVYNTYASGGKIHIKPENRGKFTALKKRTGHSASWFKEHGTPAQKKMAVFALNARKWKHEDGGPLENESEEPKINKVIERRNYNGVPITLESYKQQQRDSIVESAVERALTRDIGVYPKDEAGNIRPGCIYTATDNFGKKYRVSGNQTFFTNPEKYGFIVNGPVENARVGDLYQMFDRNTPSHMTLITGYDNSGEPLVSYESGYIGYPVSEEIFNSKPIGYFAPEDKAPDYDSYRKLILQEQRNSYKKNEPLWEGENFTGYETYRFVGTPEDNARWEQEFGNLPTYLSLPSVHNKLLDLQKEYRLPTLTKK